MGERTKLREAEKSNLTLSFNCKEENLLKRQLLSLEAMQRQSAHSWALEQQLMYHRFQLRLRRSELARGRLLGDPERQLVRAGLLGSAHLGAVNAESKQVVERLLRAGRLGRAASAPPRSWAPRDAQALHEQPGEGRREEEGAREGATGQRPGSGHTARSAKVVSFDQAQPPGPVDRQRAQGPPVRGAWLRPHTVADTANRRRYKGSATARRSASALPLSGASATAQQQHPHNPEPGSRSRAPMSTSRMLFLNLGGAEAEKLSLAQAHATLAQEAALDCRVRLFAQSVKGLQEPRGSQQRDYYCDRLQPPGGTARRRGSMPGDGREQQRWLLLGQEADHRSSTIRKLDTDFQRQSIPQDILLMEAYNRLLTEENRVVRNWPGNDPHRTHSTAETGTQ